MLLSLSSLVLRPELGNLPVWSIVAIGFSILNVVWFLGLCCNGHTGLTCRYVPMCRNGLGVLLPVAITVREVVDDIGLSWILQGS